MSQVLILVASSVFLILGLLHGVMTLGDLGTPKVFTPPDAELRRAMQRSSIRLDPSINLWDAWLGFNLSHSLGVVLFGAFFLHVGIFEPTAFLQQPLLQLCSVSVSAIYLLLSLRFWFSKPAIGSAMALTCFIIAAGLAYV